MNGISSFTRARKKDSSDSGCIGREHANNGDVRAHGVACVRDRDELAVGLDCGVVTVAHEAIEHGARTGFVTAGRAHTPDGALAHVPQHRVGAGGLTLARVGGARIEDDPARASDVRTCTNTRKTIDEVGTGAVVLTRDRGTLVNFRLAQCAGVARNTTACKRIDAIVAGGVILARVRRTLVDVGLTLGIGKACGTVACVRVYAIDTYAAVLTGV